MRGKTALFILLIFSILSLQCTPKIYDTPEVNVVYTTINVSFTVSGAMSVGSKVLFTPVISGGAGGNYKLEWDWNNDGTIDHACMYPAVNKVEHEFWEARTYTVRLKVTDKSGTASFQTNITTIEGLKPLEITCLDALNSPLMSGLEITFDGGALYGSGDYRYKWSFGDGSLYPPDGSFLPIGETSSKHIFTIGGIYNVKLTVRDSAGNEVSKTVPFDIESHTKYLIIYQRNQEIWKMYQNGADKQKIEDGIAPSCRANGSFIAFCKTAGSGILTRYRLAKTPKTGAGTTLLLTDNPADAANNEIKYYTEEDTKVSPDNSRILFRRKVKTVILPAEITPGNYILIRNYCNANDTAPDYPERQALLSWINSVYDITTNPMNPGEVTLCKLKTGLTSLQKETTAVKLYQYKDVLLNGVTAFGTAAPVIAALSPEKDIYSVSSSGGTPALFITNGEQPDFSPDGSTVAFTRDYNIYTVPSAGGGESLWIANAIYPCYPESALNIIVFSAATEYSSGVKAIHEAKLYNIEIRTLLSTFGQYDALCPRLFPDGNNLIYTTGMDAENDMMFLSSRPFGSYSIVLASTGKLKIGGIIK